MGLFRKKLTLAQQAELQEFTNTLQALREPCTKAMNDFMANTVYLGYICRSTLYQTGPIPQLDTAPLVKTALVAADSYRNLLTSARADVSSLIVANWYPKKYRKAWDSWVFDLDYLLHCLGRVLEALEQPEPLKYDPEHGVNKLAEFVTAYSWIYDEAHQYCPERILHPPELIEWIRSTR